MSSGSLFHAISPTPCESNVCHDWRNLWTSDMANPFVLASRRTRLYVMTSVHTARSMYLTMATKEMKYKGASHAEPSGDWATSIIMTFE